MSLSQGDVCLSCPGAVELGILLPHLAGVIVEEVAVAAGLLLVMARARAPEAACPKCGTVSGRVHSRYSRTLADAAIGGRPAVIVLASVIVAAAGSGWQRIDEATQFDWEFVRPAGQRTDPGSVLLPRTCGRCGGPYHSDLDDACRYCHAARADTQAGWRLDRNNLVVGI